MVMQSERRVWFETTVVEESKGMLGIRECIGWT